MNQVPQDNKFLISENLLLAIQEKLGEMPAKEVIQILNLMNNKNFCVIFNGPFEEKMNPEHKTEEKQPEVKVKRKYTKKLKPESKAKRKYTKKINPEVKVKRQYKNKNKGSKNEIEI